MAPVADGEVDVMSDAGTSEIAASDLEAAVNPRGGRKPPKLAMRKRDVNANYGPVNANYGPVNAEHVPMKGEITASPGRRIVPVHQSRIKDRPAKQNEKDSSLKIKIELDLEVEVELYARVKGDVMIGLL